MEPERITVELPETALGKVSEYVDTYTPSLLQSIVRDETRSQNFLQTALMKGEDVSGNSTVMRSGSIS